MAQQLAWWREQLTGAPLLLALPTDHRRPPVQTFNGSSHSFPLPAALVQGLRRLSTRHGATLFMTLLAAFKVLLMRYSGEPDIVVGAPIANRNRVEIEPLIGFFVNSLPLRSRLADEVGGAALTFEALLEQVKQATLDAYRHQDVPFEKIIEALQPERNLSHSPLFQVVFNLVQSASVTLHLPGLRTETVEADYPIAKFDLTLTVVEEGSAAEYTPLSAALEYNTDLFDRSTIERMAGHFLTLLHGIVGNPAQSVL